MKKIVSLSSAALITAAMLHFPAAAQDQPGDKVNQLIIYGDDVCPDSSEGEIVVCARKDEEERYRIPENLRDGGLGQAKNEAWAQRVKSYEYVGATGTNTCSPSGAGGFTGCTQALLRQAYAERGIDDTVNWGKLIEEERQKRLSRIDGEAEAVEERLLEIEAQREARLQAAAEAQERLSEQDAEANRATSDLAIPPGAGEAPVKTPEG